MDRCFLYWPGDVDAPLHRAAELATYTGKSNRLLDGLRPTNVGCWCLYVALERGETGVPSLVRIACIRSCTRTGVAQALYWVDYGRSLAQLRGRRDDATLVLRRAELISSSYVQRNPYAWETLSELVARSGNNAVGRELWGMAYRARLPA